MSGRLRVRLLGDPEVHDGAVVVEAFASPRLLSLLAFLIVHRDAAIARRRLAFIFWPDSNESQARTNLRQALHHLRHALGEAERFVHLDGPSVQWRADAPADIDVVEFERAIAGASGARSTQALERAASLYGGDLLAGCYDDWITTERERLRQQYVGVLHGLIDLAEQRADHEVAIGWGLTLLRVDPLDEVAYRRVIGLYVADGDRARALHLYHACVSTLESELGMAPSPETVELYRRVMADAGHIPSASRDPTMRVASALSLVGRKQEWEQLVDCWRATTAGRARLVAVSGEPGIGKSYLANEFRDWCTREGAATARAGAYEAEGDLPYAPLVDVLRSDALRPVLRRLDDVWVRELARLLPELHAEHGSPSAPTAQSEGARRRLFEAIARAVVPSGQPLILVIDDLHWCGAETLELLHFLVRSAAGATAPLLVIGTVRDEDLRLDHPLRAVLAGLRAIDALVEIGLRPLATDEATELAVELCGDEVAEATIERLVGAAEGNPLFLVELARSGLVGDDAADLPPRMRSVIEARLSRLPDATRDVASAAAVVGRTFTVDVVIDAMHRLEAHQVRDAVAAIDELWRRGIVREHGGHSYDFGHAKLRDVAYETTGPARRQQLHLAVAGALEGAHRTDLDPVAAQIARHYEQAGAAQRAIDFYRRAVDVAHRLFAYDEVVTLARRGVALAAQQPASAERDEEELSFLDPLGIALHAGVGHHRGDATVYERANAIRARRGRPPEPSTLRMAANLAISTRDFDVARRHGRRLLERGEASDDPLLRTEGQYLLGVTSFWLGDHRASHSHLTMALDLYRPERTATHVELFGQDPKGVCLVRLAFTAFHLGRFDEAHALQNDAVAYADDLGDAYTSAYVRSFAAWHAVDAGEPGRAAELVAVLDHVDGNVWLALHQAVIGAWAEVVHGDARAGIDRLAQLARDAAVEQPFVEPLALLLLARAHALTGHPDRGVESARTALAIAEREMPFHEVDACCVLGELLATTAADRADVERLLRRAVATAVRQAGAALELRARTALVRWLRSSDGPALETERHELSVLCARWPATANAADFDGARRELAAH